MVVTSMAPVPALSGQFEIGWRAQMGCAASRLGHARIRAEELTKAEASALLSFRQLGALSLQLSLCTHIAYQLCRLRRSRRSPRCRVSI